MKITYDDEVCEQTMTPEPFSSKRKAHLEKPPQELQTVEKPDPFTEQFSQRKKQRKLNMSAKTSTESMTSQLSIDQTAEKDKIYTRQPNSRHQGRSQDETSMNKAPEN